MGFWDICPYYHGTLVPIPTGHMPIDLFQEKKYTLFNNKKSIDIRPQVEIK
jgi:hypothetical protein